MKRRVQVGWNGWRKLSGVLCDRNISAGAKRRLNSTVVRPAIWPRDGSISKETRGRNGRG